MTTAGYTVVTLADLAQTRGLHAGKSNFMVWEPSSEGHSLRCSFAAAALAWLVYDYVLSLQDEVRVLHQ